MLVCFPEGVCVCVCVRLFDLIQDDLRCLFSLAHIRSIMVVCDFFSQKSIIIKRTSESQIEDLHMSIGVMNVRHHDQGFGD